MTTLFPLIPPAVRERIAAAESDPDISPCAFAVLQTLTRFPEKAGRERAMSISELQAAWRLRGQAVYSERWVKGAVKELIEDLQVPVGSARTEPCGYFLICDTSDIDAAERPLLAEIRSLAKRLRAMNPKSSISRELCQQLRISE